MEVFLLEINSLTKGDELEKKLKELVKNCKELYLDSEQMRELTLIEHNNVESKKNEEIKRINYEFDRIQYILNQRRNYLIKQLNMIYGEIDKNLIGDLATAEGQTEYCQHLYEKVQGFYKKCFNCYAFSKSSNSNNNNSPEKEEKKQALSNINLLEKPLEEKKQILPTSGTLPAKIILTDITTLNTEICENMPKFEKELLSLKNSFVSFSYKDTRYPQFNVNLSEIVNFTKRMGELVNASDFPDKFIANYEGFQPKTLSREPSVLFMSSSPNENYLVQYSLQKGAWYKPISLQSKNQEFLKSMVATSLNSGDIILTGGIEPNGVKGSNKCKIFIRSELSLIYLANMLSGRYSHCALEHYGKLYVIGGYDGVQKITNCEKLRYIEREIQSSTPILWTQIAPLNVPRANLSGCTFDKKTLYVFGGEQPPTLEKYNILLDTWELIPPIRDFDPLMTLSAIGIHKVDETEELVIFGSYYTFFYDTKTGIAYNRPEYISQMMERSLKYDGKVVSFTKEQPLYCITFQLHPFIVHSKTSTFRHNTDIELKTYPAAITQCHL